MFSRTSRLLSSHASKVRTILSLETKSVTLLTHSRPSIQAAKFHTSAPISPVLQHGIKRVGVIGSGQMGLGIAMVAANVARLPVVIMDVNKEQIDKGIKFMDKLLEKDVGKSKITSEHAQGTKDLVSTTQTLKDLRDVDIVIEAASENLAIKTALFADLDKECKPDAILATNTSSISITKIAAATSRAHQVIGMHFMNPVPVMKLVEIIPGLATTDNIVQTTKELATSMGKTTTVVQDVPGFVANRLLMPYINEAVILLENSWASAEDIDTTMKLGMNMPMGPLTLADFIGLDTCLAIMKVIHENTGDTKYRPSVLLQNWVQETDSDIYNSDVSDKTPAYKIGVYIKAELENVTDLQPVPDFEWHFKIECSSCHETDENWITMNAQDEYDVGGSKATANLVMKCKFCRREASASFSGPFGSYEIEQVNKFVKMAVLDCRGMEPVGFDPRVNIASLMVAHHTASTHSVSFFQAGWTALGAESGTKFDDIDLTEGDWADYDEKVRFVMVKEQPLSRLLCHRPHTDLVSPASRLVSQ
ncbi:hypothetical protein INT44_007716 [Umbelopsis vinacea]|uniref:3-hydroxyacyl-CoA dehydrogenase n=1 Tax=Umbelopsis vinacea TaxID=44442 RepID=A0A8H7PJY3_9FUNG|nr:hypothetical protein INT44_007716 [Umbelopsis vinacea]